jgi:SOS-response transcriptional repressor LexA
MQYSVNTVFRKYVLMYKLAVKIKDLRAQKGISQGKLSELTGIRQNYLSQIESGKISVGIDLIEKIFSALGFSLDSPLPSGVREVPVVGTVSAGEGIYSLREVGDMLLAFNENVDFAVKVQGDSLIEDCILSGDFLGVSDSAETKSGDLAVVEVGADRCKYVKRIYIKDKEVTLQARNPKYFDITVSKKDVKSMKKVVDVYRRLK